MVSATFALLFTPPVFWYANVAFFIFAIYRKIPKISPSMYKPPPPQYKPPKPVTQKNPPVKLKDVGKGGWRKYGQFRDL